MGLGQVQAVRRRSIRLEMPAFSGCEHVGIRIAIIEIIVLVAIIVREALAQVSSGL